MKKSKSGKANAPNANHAAQNNHLPRRRLWLFRLVALIVIPIIFFSLLELSLRLFNFGYPSSALVESEINDITYVHENSAFAYRFFPKRLAREFVPLRFNADKAEGVIRIFILGGSAAQGTPDPAFSFGRILEVMLQLRYPDKQFEVLSLAMPAINSHVVLEIAKECIKYDPDLFVVYMGNNEVIGPYGPGTVLTPIVSNISLLRLGVKLKATKISQLIALGLEKLNLRQTPNSRWKGMEMFLENPVQQNDPRLEIVYKNFNDNLVELNQISHEQGIKIIYNTIISNLKDSPPFHSVHRADITLSEQAEWDTLYAAGSVLQESAKYQEAIARYLEAAQIDSPYADLHYRLGGCYWQIQNFAQASKSYSRAREYDANRFRADKRINDIIRSNATAIKGTTLLADALSEARQNSPHGVPGNEFLHEHVHLNFKGNGLVARTILTQLELQFSDVFKNEQTAEMIAISDSLCAAYLAYNTFEQQRILKLVLNGFIKQPPFTNQLYHGQNVEIRQAEIDSLQQVIQDQGVKPMAETYQDALRKRPADWMLHYKYAGYLADNSVRKYRQAADHYQDVINAMPHDANSYVMRAVVLGKLGRFQQSLDHNQRALEMNPTIAKAYFNSGLIYQKYNKFELAVENYQMAVFYEPAHSKAYNNMAFIFSEQGDTAKAMETIDQGLQASADDLHLNYNKAIYLYQNGQKSAAIKQLRHVIQIAPHDVKIQQQLEAWLKTKK